jgi:hypothetical protein
MTIGIPETGSLRGAMPLFLIISILSLIGEADIRGEVEEQS